MISVIDMPPPDESIWWRGKRGFEVGFFPCEYVEVIGDKVPQGLNLPMGANHRLNRKDSVSSEDETDKGKIVRVKFIEKYSFKKLYNQDFCKLVLYPNIRVSIISRMIELPLVTTM